MYSSVAFPYISNLLYQVDYERTSFLSFEKYIFGGKIINFQSLNRFLANNKC